MSHMGAKTYGRKQELKQESQFDQLLADKSSKPSTAKVSLTAVKRWGMTTFTSIRKGPPVNGQKTAGTKKKENAVKRRKVEMPPVQSYSDDDPFSFDGDGDFGFVKPSSDSQKTNSPDIRSTPPKSSEDSVAKPKKFFKSSMASSSTGDAFKQLTLDRFATKKYNADVQNQNAKFDSLFGNEQTYQSPTKSEVKADIPPVKTTKSEFSLTIKVSQPVNSSKTGSSITTYSIKNLISTPETSGNSSPEILTGSSSVPDKTPSVIDDDFGFSDYSTSQDSNVHSSSSQNHYQVRTQDSDIVLSQPSSAGEQIVPPLRISVSESYKDKFRVTEAKKVEPKEGKFSFLRGKKIFQSPKKHRAVYNARHWQMGKEPNSDQPVQEVPTASIFDNLDLGAEAHDDEPLVREYRPTTRMGGENVTAVKCMKRSKELYTVVKNVKQAYMCHEFGETQEFNDDIEYLLDGLQSTTALGLRYLSVISLATKCMAPGFRMHLRAHGTVTKICSALMDAPSDPTLSLFAATLLFVLSQDRLSMDLDASTLSLMLKLLESDPQPGMSTSFVSEDDNDELRHSNPPDKNFEKVHQLCEQMKQKGHAKHLKLDNITTGNLTMETLLSLTSRRAGEWFKEELRNLGGLDHIVDTVSVCSSCFERLRSKSYVSPTVTELEKLQKIDRCLKVLENVTYTNTDNQEYLIKYKNSRIVHTCCSMLLFCNSSLAESMKQLNSSESPQKSPSPSEVFLSCLLSLLKVLLNLTHENSICTELLGNIEGVLDCIILCILTTPKYVPQEQRFDVVVLSMGLLINMIEHCQDNREKVVFAETIRSYDSPNAGEVVSVFEAFIEVFNLRIEAASLSEEQADALLDSQASQPSQESTTNGGTSTEAENTAASSQPDDLEETLMKALQKAGKHMEHSIIAAYISLFLGCVIQDNKDFTELLRVNLPEGGFTPMVEVLQKFFNFVNLTGVISTTGVKSIQRVIEILKSS